MRGWGVVNGLPNWRWGGGVYALYREGELVYIGQTGNFRTRMLCHRRRFAFDRIKTAPIHEPRERRRLERRLIRRLVPFENQAIPSRDRLWWE